MTLILFVFVIINLVFLRKSKDHLSRRETVAINGIFVFLIFLSHMTGYIDTSAPIHQGYLVVQKYMKQLVVATFLFFSGYGMYLSYQKKGQAYIQTIPKRGLNLLLQFDVCVLLFLLVQTILKKRYSIQKIILALIGWEGIGNSYWYVFVLLSLYALMYVSFTLDKKHPLIPMILGSMLLIFFYQYMGKTSNWYNTICCFPAGMIYARYKDKVRPSFLSFLLLLGVFLISHQFMFKSLIFYGLMAISFCLIFCYLDRYISFQNPVTTFLGNHAFAIFMLQRIPMIIGKAIGLHTHFYLYFFFNLAVTLILAVAFGNFVATKQLK